MTLTVVLNAHLSKLASEKEKILTFHDSITVFSRFLNVWVLIRRKSPLLPLKASELMEKHP